MHPAHSLYSSISHIIKQKIWGERSVFTFVLLFYMLTLDGKKCTKIYCGIIYCGHFLETENPRIKEPELWGNKPLIWRDFQNYDFYETAKTILNHTVNSQATCKKKEPTWFLSSQITKHYFEQKMQKILTKTRLPSQKNKPRFNQELTEKNNKK